MAMIKCPECRKKISSNATVCPNCGMPLDPAQANNNSKKPKSNKKLIIIAILLILMVIGAVSGDKEEKTSEITTETVTESINNPGTTSETESTKIVLTEKEQFALNASTDFNEELANTAYDLLTEMGFSWIEYERKSDNGYMVASVEINKEESNSWLPSKWDLYIEFVDGILTYIGNESYVLYQDNEIKMNYDQLEARYISLDDQAQYITWGKKWIEESLKAPSTVKYIDDSIRIGKNYNYVMMAGELDAQNSFGAMLRNKLRVVLQQVNENGTYEALNEAVYPVSFINTEDVVKRVNKWNKKP